MQESGSSSVSERHWTPTLLFILLQKQLQEQRTSSDKWTLFFLSLNHLSLFAAIKSQIGSNSCITATIYLVIKSEAADRKKARRTERKKEREKSSGEEQEPMKAFRGLDY